MRGEFATGLQGCFPPGSSLEVHEHGSGSVVRKFHGGDRWTIRWDYDPDKGPHVNVSLGSTNAMRWAMLSNRGSMSASMAEDKFQDIVRDQSRAIGFNRNDPPSVKGRYAEDMVIYWADRYFAPPPNWLA